MEILPRKRELTSVFQNQPLTIVQHAGPRRKLVPQQILHHHILLVIQLQIPTNIRREELDRRPRRRCEQLPRRTAHTPAMPLKETRLTLVIPLHQLPQVIANPSRHIEDALECGRTIPFVEPAEFVVTGHCVDQGHHIAHGDEGVVVAVEEELTDRFADVDLVFGLVGGEAGEGEFQEGVVIAHLCGCSLQKKRRDLDESLRKRKSC